MKNTISIKITTNDNGELIGSLMGIYATDGQISIENLTTLIGGNKALTLISITNEVIRQESEIELSS